MDNRILLRQRIRTGSFWVKQLRDISIILVILFFITSYLQRDMINGQAPNLSAVTVSQQSFDLTTLASTSTKPTLIYFWGSWCSVCKITSPMVNSVASSNDYQVISIAVASGSDDDITQYMQLNQLSFEVINEAQLPQVINQPSLSQQWGANAFPSIYIIDKNQHIRFVTSGVTTTWGLKLRLWLTTFL
ncbi:protein disulfide oxidoreductase [Shewanella glacialimarina]|jgi:thiol-disulfide isomerase/thioredoxin|uniref:protein disulfide oxidoreductase n=1 Tax=Shewanella glacialimarina TaxID=2590884 RepID=UPI001CF84363|nr:protein disulfide oxidoreductase [Shewanella glacialimarina]UCX04013.1 protein disulfide oxidoreductase [Shewanella glacialimarina]